MTEPMSDEVLADYERGFEAEGELRGVDTCREIRRLRQERLEDSLRLVKSLREAIRKDRETMEDVAGEMEEQGLTGRWTQMLRARVEAK